jgi:hypothetical protein
MKLVMTLLVRDEEEVLEANLEYHLAQGVDFMVVTDHGSTDATPEILHEYESRGLAHVFRVEGGEHHQSRRVTRMARLAAIEYGADWVINNDADEFWWPVAGTLAEAFAAVPECYGQVAVRRNNFLPCPIHDHGAFYERLILRERCSQNLLGEPLEPKIAHRGRPDVRVAPGNHSVHGEDLAPAPSPDRFEVLHFPMRTEAQFEQKVLAIGTGYESLPFRGDGVGRDQLKLLELHRQGKLGEYYAAHVLSADEIAEGLDSGKLVLDRRLAGFMTQLELDGANEEAPT